ncbi:MAG: NTP transferase domain-containing protein, partial [Thermomicrobium sp.]
MARVAGIVLAAGFSRRLGQPKQLVNLCGKPALQYILDAARQAPLEPLILVLSPEIPVAASGLDTSGFAVVTNLRAREGQSTSLQAGLTALPPDIDA